MPASPDHHPLLSRLATLTDPARLRMLRLLDRQEVSVGELARSLQLPQSTVSRHLKLLHADGWTVRRSEGTASLYRLSEAALSPERRQLWKLAQSQLDATPTPTHQHDDARLAEVIASRHTDPRAFFRRLGTATPRGSHHPDDNPDTADRTGMGGAWNALRRDLYGQEFTAEALLGLIPPDWVIADLGCGPGNATALLAPLVRRVIAIDREPAMLDAARARLKAYSNIEYRHGELNDLPLEPGEINAAVMFLVLTYIGDPAHVVQQVLSKFGRGGIGAGGTLLVVDLAPHDRESYRHTMGHLHLGFDDAAVRSWVGQDGLQTRRAKKSKRARGTSGGSARGTLGGGRETHGASDVSRPSVSYRLLRPSTSSKGPPLFAAVLRTG